jgi:hypothetical protein
MRTYRDAVTDNDGFPYYDVFAHTRTRDTRHNSDMRHKASQRHTPPQGPLCPSPKRKSSLGGKGWGGHDSVAAASRCPAEGAAADAADAADAAPTGGIAADAAIRAGSNEKHRVCGWCIPSP